MLLHSAIAFFSARDWENMEYLPYFIGSHDYIHKLHKNRITLFYSLHKDIFAGLPMCESMGNENPGVGPAKLGDYIRLSNGEIYDMMDAIERRVQNERKRCPL